MKIFITIFLLIFIFITAIPCQTFKDDSMAVVAIFKEKNQLDWNTISKFYINTQNGRISTLRLDEDCIRDTIPPDIGKLTELTELTIDETWIKSLPAEIGNLTKLQKLVIKDNDLKVLPSIIGNLTELRHLSLIEECEFSSLPPEIKHLTKLEYLHIEGDVKSLPPEIKHLTKLEYLHIESGGLKSLPKEIGSFINLKHFGIDDNSLNNLSFDISKLGNLEKLVIKCPLLKLDSLQEAIYTLVNLHSLSIIKSQITRISGNIKKLKELYSLWLNNNNISHLTPEIGNLSKLKILTVMGNNIQNLPIEIINLKPDSICNFESNYLNEKELSDDVAHWLDTYNPNWRHTQKTTGVQHIKMKDFKPAVLSYSIRTNVLTYQLDKPGKITLKLFDISGKCKYVFVDNIIGSGSKKCDLNTGKSSLCNGTYLLMFQVYNGSVYTSHNRKIVYLQ